ncbi:tRNA (cytidine(34)-2'-O)-methyltransferase [Cyanobium sp. ATX 6F1]|uniref:tRNA (cytidine(34)-2'-O)-methyltransferase n=1 Tax=Cyanobium sp. ATX 6F1 TaxID=2823702 RepID=UPI0020CF06F8|nr:tRNA (cytidine(34)-2'-O)-methyltransferase [Cyanobium sp. ATX 6F1]MCP9916102.1 tRNA (cytidine(34)-2'-O)-methyltransferase [Cyanobium sp. ATX 6F1]
MPQVVLYQPQIPPNTGNVARTCAATGTPLHLIEPLGFTIDDRQLKRAGLDYWPWVSLERHSDLEQFERQRLAQGGRLVALSSQGSAQHHRFSFRPDDWLLFGRETDGLPAPLLEQADACLTIPMPRGTRAGGGVRSLNLSVAVGVVLFEALRQLEALS